MSRRSPSAVHVPLVLGMLLVALPFTGCDGDDGAAGASTGTLTGTVTNTANASAPVANATLVTTPDVGVTITTNASGVYSAALPVGAYSVEVTATDFEPFTFSVSILAAQTMTQDAALDPVSNVVVAITGEPAAALPGEMFDLTATATPMDGSTVTGYAWTQMHSAPATIANATSQTANITLADVAAYKLALLAAANVLDRFEIVGLDPHSIEEGSTVIFECEVTTSSGTYHGEVEVPATLAFAAWTSQIPNIPTGLPLIVGGADQATYDWALSPPGGSATTLNDATGRFPWFMPDIAGTYNLTVTDLATMMPWTIDIYAAAWVGGITGQDANGRPEMGNCTTCHTSGGIAGTVVDEFTDWAETGHAEIFTNNLNTGGHYSDGCFDCHTVGYNTTAVNGGMDDTTDYAAFYAAMFPNGNSVPDPNNWDTVLANWPNQAQMANIQCENCHGPNGQSGAHTLGAPRYSTNAYVCAFCHGEPPRHARFQQWEESGHGNYQLAIDEANSGSCARCHTAQGFLEWFELGFPLASVTAVDPAVAQPQTCVVCHDPHNVGTTSGHDTDAQMRVEGDTPPLLAGFTAYSVGSGAQCIVCHNSRRGLANDAVGLPDPANWDRAPHGSAQGDMLMGQNAYFVNVGLRGAHSLVVDSCAACHVQLTPPPAELSYNLGGTNHTFEADPTICSNCHGLFDAGQLRELTENRLADLAVEYGRAISEEIAFQIGAGNTVDVTGEVATVPTTVTITGASVINSIEVVEYHGRAAMNIDVDGTLVEHVRLSSDTDVLDGTMTSLGNLLENSEAGNEGLNLAKVGWNYWFMHNDGSYGNHNPDFLNRIVVATFGTIALTWP